MNISFIGYGNIARALTNGLVHSGRYHIRASSPSLKNGTDEVGVETTPSNLAIVPKSDVIILAVKPAQMAIVLAEIQPLIPNDCLLISVATGLTLSWFTERTSPKTAVIRAMPNIAASIGKSATPLLANNNVTPPQKKLAEQIMQSIGITTWVNHEMEIEIFTALSGSGPAYVFQFIQSMIDAAVYMGLDESIAKTFALQTLSGATALAMSSSKSLEELRNDVTSPGGTTAAALQVFKNKQFHELISDAMSAARDRARQLSLT